MTLFKLATKLEGAKDRERDAARALVKAANNVPTETRKEQGSPMEIICRIEGTEWEALASAAKKWTNAMHQRSRCEKHLREAQS